MIKLILKHQFILMPLLRDLLLLFLAYLTITQLLILKTHLSVVYESVTSNDDETTDHLNDSSEQRRFLLEQHNTIVHRKSKSNVTRRHNQEVSALMSKRDNKMNGSFITSESSNTSEETSIDSNSNDGKGYEHLFDTSSMSSYSSEENASMSDNHCSFDNMSSPVTQSQGPSTTNIDISGSLRRVRSRESFNNLSSLKKSNTDKHFPSNNSTNTLSTASSSVSSLSSSDSHNSNVEFALQKSQPHHHLVRKRVTVDECQPVCTAPVLTRNNINKPVFFNNSNAFLSTFSSINDPLPSSGNTKYDLNYNMNSNNEIFSVPEFQHQCVDNNITINRQEPQSLRNPPILKKSSFSKRVSFSDSNTQVSYSTTSMRSSSPPNCRYSSNYNGNNKNAVFVPPKPQNPNYVCDHLNDEETFTSFFPVINLGKDQEDTTVNEKKSKKNMKEKTKAMGKKVKSLPNLVFSKAFQRNKNQKRITRS